MKKLISLLLALVMIFSLCACTNPGYSDRDEDQEEDAAEYPVVVKFEMYGVPYKLTVEDEKDITLTITMDVEIGDAQLVGTMCGTYKEKKGILKAEFDSCTVQLKNHNEDNQDLVYAVEDACGGLDEDELEALINGKKVDLSDEMEAVQDLGLGFEVDGDVLERMYCYADDEIQMEYVFYKQGMLKKEISYSAGEPWYYYEYDTNGELIDEGYQENDDDSHAETTAPVPEHPTDMPTEPVPTEPEVELRYYSVTIWVSEQIVDLTYSQIDEFNNTNEYGIYIDAWVEGISEGDAASYVENDPASAADLFCFAQDQLARLVAAGALSILNRETANYISNINDTVSVQAATCVSDMYAYPMTSDNGYFMYYDKSIISDPTSLEAIIADCENSGRKFRFALNNAWYVSSFFFATGCYSQWEINGDGEFIGVNDNFNSEAGLIALEGMQKLMHSSCYDSNADIFMDAAVVVTGKWNDAAARAQFGNNYGAAELPWFEVDGNYYHLSSFHGAKLMGVKPQWDADKEYALHLLAQYLTGEQCQLERYESNGYCPSNLNAQQSDAVQSDPSLIALHNQARYAVPQGQINGRWWDIAKCIATDVYDGMDPQVALENYEAAIIQILFPSDEVRNAFTVIGSVAGTMWDVDFTMVKQYDGTWKTEDMLYFQYGSEYKIRQGLSWEVNFGADGIRDGENIMPCVEGWYYVVFDPWTGLTWLEEY